MQYATARGFEIGAHASDDAHHIDWSTQSLSWAQTELTTLRNWLASHNVPSPSFAWPNGAYDATLADAAGKFFVFARTNATFVDTAFTPRPLCLSAQVVNASMTLATAKALVDQVKAGRGWNKFVFHNIVASGATGNDWNRSDFNALIDYIAAQRVAVVPQGLVRRRASLG